MVEEETFDSLFVRWEKANQETEKHRDLLGWLTGRLAKAQEEEERLYAQLVSAAISGEKL